MKAFLDHWERFWFSAIPPHIYSLLRIVFGSLGCVALLGVSELSAFWDLDGFTSSQPWYAFKSFLVERGLASSAGRVLYAVSMAAFVAMAIGYRSGAAVPLAFAAALAQMSWSAFPLSGAHSVMLGMLFCLMWADCGAVWSLDAWLRRSHQTGSSPAITDVIAPLRLMRFQVAVIYLNTGLWKIFSPVWRDGSAVHYVLNQNVFQRFAADRLPASLDWIGTVLTYTTLVWEIAFAGMILFRPTRALALGVGILIHLGMLFSIDVGLFSLMMLASYIAFLSPERVAAGVRAGRLPPQPQDAGPRVS